MNIAEKLAVVKGRIALACLRAGRDPAEVLLVAVSKGYGASAIVEAANAGLTVFGESRVQEAKAKIPECPQGLRWQMIGHLQSNKCRDAVQLFESIHSVDSLRLALDLSRRCNKNKKAPKILLEVNITGEASKFGFSPVQLLAEVASIAKLPGIELRGLMTLAPNGAGSADVRSCFRQLKCLRDQCEDRLGVPLPELSMGMSGDYEIAVEEGSTMLRIGAALFGERRST